MKLWKWTGVGILVTVLAVKSAFPATIGRDVIDADAFADFATAVSTLCPTGDTSPTRTLIVQTLETVAANVTVCKPVTLEVTGSGELSVNSTFTVTINGPLEAPLRQVFSGAGTIAFGSGYIEKVYPQYWGEVGDGVADDTAEIQSALDAHSRVGFPAGDYLTSADLTLSSNHYLSGVGKGSKIFTTTNNINIFSCISANNIFIEKLQLVGNNTSSAITNGNGIFFQACNDITIKDNFLHNFGGADNNSSAIQVYLTSNRVYIENNYIDGGVGTANASDILVYNTGGEFHIIGNRTYSTNSSGILGMATGGAKGIITGNYSKNHSRHGIESYTDGIKELIIANNHSESNGWTGIYLANSSSAIIQGNYVKNNGDGSLNIGQIRAGIALNATDKVVIDDNIIQSPQDQGIWVNNSGDITITSNQIFSSAMYGIVLYQSFDNFIIDDNLIKASANRSIYFHASSAADNVSISDNEILDPGDDGIVLDGATGALSYKVSDNILTKTGANTISGIMIKYGQNFVVNDNVVRGFDYGIELISSVDTGGSKITDNVIADSLTYGIRVSAQNLIIRDNVYDNNPTDVSIATQTNVNIKTLANSATPSVSGGYYTFLTGGTTTITDFTNGYIGMTFTLISEHAITITNGTNIFLGSGVNFAMKSGDTLTLTQKADGNWYQTSRNAERATALVVGDFSLHANWGTTASVGTITGNDMRAKFTVTSAGTGQTADPTITLTFTDGAFATAPFINVVRNGGSQLSITQDWVESTTTLIITWRGTPIAAETFTFEFITMG